MGIVALPPSGTGEFAPHLEVGTGPAELFVAVGIVYTLTLLYLLDAVEPSSEHGRAMRGTIFAASVSLLFAFGAIVLYSSLAVL